MALHPFIPSIHLSETFAALFFQGSSLKNHEEYYLFQYGFDPVVMRQPLFESTQEYSSLWSTQSKVVGK